MGYRQVTVEVFILKALKCVLWQTVKTHMKCCITTTASHQCLQRDVTVAIKDMACNFPLVHVQCSTFITLIWGPQEWTALYVNCVIKGQYYKGVIRNDHFMVIFL